MRLTARVGDLQRVLVDEKNSFLKHKETWQGNRLTLRALPDPEPIDRQIRLSSAGIAHSAATPHTWSSTSSL